MSAGSRPSDAIADLDYLAAHGFEVTITAWRARHFRGSTVAVEIVERVIW